MKKSLILLFGVCQFLLANSFVYLKENIENRDFSLKKGLKVEILKKEKNKTKVTLKAFINNKNELFYDNKFILKIGTSSINKIDNNYEFLIENKDITKEKEEAWEDFEELYYESCSQCHSAMDAKEHTMLEWEGIFDSMKGQAQLEEDEEKKVLYYLKSHSKNGFIKETN